MDGGADADGTGKLVVVESIAVELETSSDVDETRTDSMPCEAVVGWESGWVDGIGATSTVLEITGGITDDDTGGVANVVDTGAWVIPANKSVCAPGMKPYALL